MIQHNSEIFSTDICTELNTKPKQTFQIVSTDMHNVGIGFIE